MSKDRKKKSKTGPPAGKRIRNPFAGRKQSGAGFHSESRYGKKDRREKKKEIEAEEDPPGSD